MSELLSIHNTSIRQMDGLYCLNDLHKAAGAEVKHEPHNFTRNDRTIALINEISKSAESRITPIESKKGTNGGTYVCKELVYAYAMWVSAKFHLHVIRAFDQGQQVNTTQLAANMDEQSKRINGLANALLKVRPEFKQVGHYLGIGLSSREIALLLECSQHRVGQIKAEMTDCGLLAKQIVKNSTPLRDDEKAMILQLKEDGDSPSAIARIIGRSSSAVSRYIKREANQ